MSTTADNVLHRVVAAERGRPAYQAYLVLRLGFTLAPILAGADKFFHFLCNWDQYLAPWVVNISPVSGHALMLAVGIVEIAAGILVAIRPRIGSLLVAAWLSLIVMNLITAGVYLDVALRDFGLALGALALWLLSHESAD